MNKPKLRLYTDRLSATASLGPLSKTNRVIYVCYGTATVRGPTSRLQVSMSTN